MQDKIYFLFLALLLIDVQVTSIDLYNPKGGSALDYTKAGDDADDYDTKKNYANDQTVDSYAVTTTNARNRYPSNNRQTNNYRQQSRGPSSYENSYDSYDKSGYGNAYDSYDKSRYGNSYDSYDKSRSGYGNSYDSYDRPRNGYANSYDSYDKSRNGYGNSYDLNDRSRYGYGNSYDSNDRSRYGYGNSYDLNDRSGFGFGLDNILSSLSGAFPPAAFDNGPSCYPLLDPLYPLFSDICGAVPQARYSLPNAFGHIERWQIAQVLATIVDPSSPSAAIPTCARSIRLLVCPLLFPPCSTRYEPPPVLPCQSFCRGVKNQCASPSLSLLPCELLPPVSDLCPLNPSPFGPMSSPFGPMLPPFGPPSPFMGGLPPSFLAQSALSMAMPPPELSLSPFSPFFPPSGPQSLFPQSPFSPSLGFPGASPSAFPQFGPSPVAFPQYGSAPVNAPAPEPVPAPAPAPAPSSMPPTGGLPPSPFASMFSMGGMPPPSLASIFSTSGLPPMGMPSMLSPPGMTLSPFHQLLNAESYLSDSLTPILVDFPPIGNFESSFRPNFRPPHRFFPSLRSGTEKV